MERASTSTRRGARARGGARSSGNRALLPFRCAAPERKTKEQIAIEKS